MSDSFDYQGEKKNIHAYRLGTNDGEIKFGHVTSDNEVSAVLLRSGFFFNHYIEMDGTGEAHRSGGTICRSPGSFQVNAGDNNGPGDQTVLMRAQNGDIFLSAPNGKIILDAKSILIKASGNGGGTGMIEIDANEKVNIYGKGDGVSINGTAAVKLVSDKTVDVIGGTVCNIYGGIMDMADGNATSTVSKPSKTGVKAASAVNQFNVLSNLIASISPLTNLEQKMGSYGSLFK